MRKVISELEKEYGKMTVTTGKEHTYCGMNLIFRNKRLTIDMKEYLEEAIKEFPKDCSRRISTPAATHLFDINPSQTKLEDERKTVFHRLVAKLLFVSKRGRPDIQVAIAFLTTRVTEPDEDDWQRLKRLMYYISSTIDIRLALSVDGFNSIKWWVDASYAVHPTIRSHTGGTMTLGQGSIYSASTKQKITSKSLTEAELIGLNDIAEQILWTRNFLIEQGYNTEASTVYQDNKSTMLLANNGILSLSK